MAAPIPAPVKAEFRQRRVADSFRSEFRKKPLAYRIATAIAANVLAHKKDPLITNERIADRLAHRFAIAELGRFGLV